MPDASSSRRVMLLVGYFVVLAGQVIWFSADTNAAVFGASSDLIIRSSPSATTTHDITLTSLSGIPLGGTLRLSFEDTSGAPFVFPALLDYTDIDLAFSTSGPFIERELGSELGSTTADYVFRSSNGNIEYLSFTLGDGVRGSIPAGATINIRIGTNATVGHTGDELIENPSVPGSYRIRLESFTAGGVAIDYGAAMIAVVTPVTLGPVDTTDSVPPFRYDGRPFSTSTLLGNTVAVQISLRTDKLATCRYATSTGVDYSLMTNSFTAISLGLLHYFTLTPVTASTTYGYYVRCRNSSGYTNPDDFLISFSVAPTVTSGTGSTTGPVYNPPGPVQGPPGRSSFSGPGPAGGPFLGTGEVTIDGDTFPNASVVYMKDGNIVAEELADATGHFTMKFSQLDRGTYTWGMYARAPDQKNSGVYSSTIFLIANTNNIIAPVYLSPTISATSSIGVGEDLEVSGYAIGRKPVHISLSKQGDSANVKTITATTTADASGRYRVTLLSSSLPRGTYEAKALSVISDTDSSILSPPHFVGIGESPNVDFRLRADLNKDGKVNLVDFSILLFNWKGADPVADINLDGTVNLTDFSIMLTYWTG